MSFKGPSNSPTVLFILNLTGLFKGEAQLSDKGFTASPLTGSALLGSAGLGSVVSVGDENLTLDDVNVTMSVLTCAIHHCFRESGGIVTVFPLGANCAKIGGLKSKANTLSRLERDPGWKVY